MKKSTSKAASKSGTNKKGTTKSGANVKELTNLVNGFGRSAAMIEFTLDGTVVNANANFCNALGYRPEEIKGQHHSKFVDPTYAKSPEYRQFWNDLKNGIFQAGEFRRVKSDGSDIWIQASYNPILDDSGKAYKVVKLASDISAAKQAALASQAQAQEFTNQINGFSASQAMIEFNLDGTVVNANANFCNALGYRLEEIKGQHHSRFCDPTYTKSPEYRQFWNDLNNAKFSAGEFCRVKKDGSEIWIQASYNPVLDKNGKAYKVIKLATDITIQKQNTIAAAMAKGQAEADKIAKVLENVALSADQIDQGSQQIATSSQSLSEGASEQAANLEEISASLEEMTSMTTQSADNSRQAATLSEEAAKSSKKGEQEMTAMSQAMDEIKKSSAEISKIIRVIDEIAFQTNLLALNAAVEAARAGEAGKGFAVVAEEVRNLAQRSAEAAKNTSSMIEESTKRADNGVSIAKRVSTSLEEIGASTTKVNTLLAEIASAAKEQAEGIAQVTKGVTELDKVTQQNAGNAEELAAAAQQTAAQVSSLRDVVASGSGGGADDDIAPKAATQRHAASKPTGARSAATKPAATRPSAPSKREALAASVSAKGARQSAERALPMHDKEGALATF